MLRGHQLRWGCGRCRPVDGAIQLR